MIDHRDSTGTANEAAAIRAEIDETRAHMSETIDALGDRLNPRHVKERVKEEIRDATIGRVQHMAREAGDKVRHAGESVLDVVRENPIPAAMLGVGAAWLLMNRRGGRSSTRNSSNGTYREHGRDALDAEWNYPSTFGGRESSLPATVRDKADALKDKADDLAHRVADGSKQAAHRVRTETRRQVRNAEDYYDRNPLVIGVLALGAGLALGLAVPASETENRWLGEARDKVVDKAREVAKQKGEQVQHVAERVYEEGKRVARTAAEEEGLTRGLLDDGPAPEPPAVRM